MDIHRYTFAASKCARKCLEQIGLVGALIGLWTIIVTILIVAIE